MGGEPQKIEPLSFAERFPRLWVEGRPLRAEDPLEDLASRHLEVVEPARPRVSGLGVDEEPSPEAVRERRHVTHHLPSQQTLSER